MNSNKRYYLPAYHANNPEYHEIMVDCALGRSSLTAYRRLNNLRTIRAAKEFLKISLVAIAVIDIPLCILFIIKTILYNPLPFAEILDKLPGLFVAGLIGCCIISGLTVIIRGLIWEIQDLCMIISIRRANKRKALY